MTEEQIKEHLLANFCDGDSWEDAKADRFTHEGALEIAKYFHDEGFKAGSEQNNPAVEGTETEEDIRGAICRMTSSMLDNPDVYGIYPTTKFYNETEAFIRETIQSTRADERKKLVEVVKGIVKSPAYMNLKERQGQVDEDGVCVIVSRQALDETFQALEDVLAKISQV